METKNQRAFIEWNGECAQCASVVLVVGLAGLFTISYVVLFTVSLLKYVH